MKEATGELNMTVITVVAIAAIAAFFYAFIWPAIKNNLAQNTYCSTANCSGCTTDSSGKRTCTTCTYIDDKGSEKTIKCTFNDTSTNIK